MTNQFNESSAASPVTHTIDGAVSSGKSETITLGGGCFWCTEAVFDQVKGITDVESGYCNGHVKNPSYEAVCSGNTGHVEVVKLVFDPLLISLEQILQIFFVVHDPTTPNRQGNDSGTQYRSGIYYSTPEHQAVAQAFLAELAAKKVFYNPVVTELKALDNYSAAEAYHQDYFANHPGQGYCAFVAAPKVEKFRKTFAALAK
ncbi:MAG: peptide-methionine (S)-S-oxide reductase MsrA [Burkholderiales bacterium]